jgi:aminoglycoside 6'-N-acetyltransferase
MTAPAYQFRPMSMLDLAMVRAWLATAHVQEWWGDAEEQFALVSGDLAEPAMDQFVVACDGRHFAYLQCYDQSAWPENGLGTHPPGARGIDQFIGEADMVGRGHGSAFIRVFVDGLLTSGVPRVLTDPDPANGRAVRAYVNAGFRAHREVGTPDGRALLMIRDNPEPTSAA